MLTLVKRTRKKHRYAFIRWCSKKPSYLVEMPERFKISTPEYFYYNECQKSDYFDRALARGII